MHELHIIYMYTKGSEEFQGGVLPPKETLHTICEMIQPYILVVWNKILEYFISHGFYQDKNIH